MRARVRAGVRASKLHLESRSFAELTGTLICTGLSRSSTTSFCPSWYMDNAGARVRVRVGAGVGVGVKVEVRVEVRSSR